MNTATEFEPNRTCPLPFENLSFNRYFVHGKAMLKIFMNWKGLNAYFTSDELAQSQCNTKFKARFLKEMLSDYKNYLFFEFATPVVQEFEILNSLFQQTKADPHELHQQIFSHQKSLQNRLYDAKGRKINIHQVEFGVNFLRAFNKFLQQNNNAEFHLEIQNDKGVCLC
jgi:hypothetical protein